ncbi:unnamed protein product, partial [Symbiodinium necroappetens]
ESRPQQMSRTQNFKDGFMRSLQSCASLVSAKNLDKEVIAKMPEAAEDLWVRTRRDAESMLRNPSMTASEFKKYAQELQGVIKDVASLFKHEIRLTESDSAKVVRQVAEKVAELVLKDLEKLMPICPHHLFNKRCEAHKGKGECPLEHPDVSKTHDSWQLLGISGGKATIFHGIGLNSWLGIVNICQNSVRTGQPCKGRCRWMHPEKYELQKIQEKLRNKCGTYYFDWAKVAHLEVVAEVLLQSLQGEGADLKIPNGFGCCFFKDGDKMLNVRLATILASAFLNKRCCDLGLEASTEVLLRMCRSLYRYPDPQAADLAKATLAEV